MKIELSKKETPALRVKNTLSPYLFISPLFIALLLFCAWPLGTAFVKSFFRYDALRINEFIGLENYREILFGDQIFWKSLKNLFYLFLAMNVCFCSPIIAAKLVHSLISKRTQFTFRTIFLLPMVVPGVVTMMLWKFIYYPQIGLIARVTKVFGIAAPNFLGDPSTSMLSVVFIGFPWIAGFNFLMILAALQGVDRSIVESAKIDGASSLKTFFKIELPQIVPQIKYLYILAFIGQFQDYERFLILTDGGPSNSTLVPGLHMYHMAFSKAGAESRYGYACAIAVLLFIITLICTILLQRKKGKTSGRTKQKGLTVQ